MNIAFSPQAWKDYLDWQQTDKRVLKKVNQLLQDILRNPYAGIGKPEPLKHAYSGFWSRRITDEHRLIYQVEGEIVLVAKVGGHYE